MVYYIFHRVSALGFLFEGFSCLGMANGWGAFLGARYALPYV